MKKLSYLFVVIVMGLFLQSAARAQISISASDLTNAFSVGISQFDYSSTDTVLMNIGTASGSSSQTWAAPSVKINDSLRLDGAVPSSTPYSANFLGATYALHAALTQGPLSIAFYEYFKLSNDSLISLGGVQHLKGSIGGQALDSTALKIKVQGVFAFPLHLGQSFTHQTDTIYAQGPDVETQTETDVFDAYGTLNLSNGSFGALRQTATTVTKVYISGVLQNTVTSYTISWQTESGNQLSVDVDTLSSGNVRVHSVSITYIGTTPATLVRSLAQAPENFTLSQNYPNPFNPSTQIQFSVAHAGFVSLKVYDMLGREVATLISRDLSPQSYSVTWNAADLPSGVYFYKLDAEGKSVTKKMILMK